MIDREEYFSDEILNKLFPDSKFFSNFISDYWFDIKTIKSSWKFTKKWIEFVIILDQ